MRSVLQAAATVNGLTPDSGSDSDSSADLRPDPSVARKLSLCKKVQGRADQENKNNSEPFSLPRCIDATVTTLAKKLFQRIRIALPSQLSLWAPGHCLVWCYSMHKQCILCSAFDCLRLLRIIISTNHSAYIRYKH